MQDGQIRFINVFIASLEAWYTFERPERKLCIPEVTPVQGYSLACIWQYVHFTEKTLTSSQK